MILKINEIKSSFRYFRPETLEEATDFLMRRGSESKILAGGTDLLVAIRSGDLRARYVVDVSRLDELRKVTVDREKLTIGSALTFSEIIENPIVQEFAPVLVRACSRVGSLQIRNTGTLGGNVGNASPAADSIPAMMIHDARVLLTNAESERDESLGSFIVGPYKTNLATGFLISGFSLKIWPEGFRFAYNRIARRRCLAISRVGAAAMAVLDENGKVTRMRLSLSSVSPQPVRMKIAEECLVGQIPDSRLILEASQAVTQEMVHLSGERPSFAYKKPAVQGLTTKTLEEIFFDREEF